MALPYCHGEIEESKVFVKCLLYLKTLLKNERQSETERERDRGGEDKRRKINFKKEKFSMNTFNQICMTKTLFVLYFI